MKNKKSLIALGVIVVLAIVGMGIYKNRQQTADDNVISVGVILPLTGSYSSEGIRGQRAMEMAVEDILRSSEYTYKVKLLVEDDKYTGKDSINAANKLLLHGVDAFISFGTPPTQAIKERIDSIGMPLLAMDGSAGLAASSQWIFECFPPLHDVGEAAGIFSRKTYNPSKTALLTMNCSGGNDFARGFKAQVRCDCFHDDFEPDATDARSQISKLLSIKPEVFCVFGYGVGYTTVMKQLLDSGYEGVIVTDSNVTSIIDKLAHKDRDLYFVSQNYGPASSSKACQEFMQTFQMRFNMEPTVFSAHMYEMVRMVAMAANDSNKEKEQIRLALANMKNFQSMFGPMSFDEAGSIHLPFSVMRIRNNVIELVEGNVE